MDILISEKNGKENWKMRKKVQKKIWKKVFAVALSGAMTVTMLPASAFAAQETISTEQMAAKGTTQGAEQVEGISSAKATTQGAEQETSAEAEIQAETETKAESASQSDKESSSAKGEETTLNTANQTETVPNVQQSAEATASETTEEADKVQGEDAENKEQGAEKTENAQTEQEITKEENETSQVQEITEEENGAGQEQKITKEKEGTSQEQKITEEENGAGQDQVQSEGMQLIQESTEDATNGTCGEDAKWEVKDGTLFITGTGEMEDYETTWNYEKDELVAGSDAPWYGQRDNITSISIGDGITSIGYAAFACLSHVTSVTISNSVTDMGAYAFYECSGLTEMTIPDSVKTIGSYSFYHCSALAKAAIPSGATYIGGYAFYGCGELTEMTIPDSVNEIKRYAFDNCAKLQSIKILNPDCKIYNEEDTISSGATIYGYGASTAEEYTAQFERTFSSIGYCIRYDANGGKEKPNSQVFDHSVTLSEDKLTREGYEFVGWSENMTSKTATYEPGETVTQERGMVLYAIWKSDGTCGKNLKWEVKDGTLYITGTGKMYKYLSDPDDEKKERLREKYGISYPANADEIYEGDADSDDEKENMIRDLAPWFDKNKEITSISIGDGVTSIGDFAFLALGNVTSVHISDSVEQINGYAFSGCEGLKQITIPDSVTQIRGFAFSACTGLTEITIPSSVTELYSYSFSECKGLKKVMIPNSVTAIWGGAFSGCTGLTEIAIPDSVTEVATEAFSGCTGLKEVTIPGGVTEVGDSVFSGCTGLKKVTMPNGIKAIRENTFSNCTSLTELTIPSGVAQIDPGAFSGCTGLTKMTIPNSVVTIFWNAFEKCSSLKSIKILNSNCNIYDDAETISSSAAIYGHKNSTAQEYAKKYNRTFKSLDEKKIKYTVKFHANGGTGTMDKLSCTYGTSKKLTANAFKRKGYTFTGWNTKKDGSGTAYKNKASVKNLTSTNNKTITLYAQWKARKYTISYQLNGGKNNKNNPTGYTIRSKKITFQKPTRKGYTFVNWYRDAQFKTKKTIIPSGSTGSMTLYAKWKANTYKVKFHANGGKGKMSTISCTYGMSKKLKANAFKRSGYKFVGWNTKANGKGTTYKNKASIKNLSSVKGKTVTLYAQWKKKKK